MDQFVIEGAVPLKGKIRVSGSKNASLPLLVASMLARGTTRFSNVPALRDTDTLIKILAELGTRARKEGAELLLETDDEGPVRASYELVSTQRASFYVLGALLGRRRRAVVSLPGGCVIGFRPVDLHLKGFEALNVKIQIKGGYVEADASRARAARVFLGGAFGSSVGATINVLLLAVTLPGISHIDNAACEPEVTEVCRYLMACGAKIRGAGSPHLTIEGVESLKACPHSVISDRIEAGSYLLLGCHSVARDLVVENVELEEQGALLDVISTMGYEPEEHQGGIRMRRVGEARPVECTTLPYPGFPTDCQAQLMVLLTQFPQLSVITEKVYPDRFIHTAEIARMGARIKKEGASVFINGGHPLSGAPVMASDLRASFALVMAGLIAEGQTIVNRVYHIDRGYENVVEKFAGVGAKITRQNVA